MPWGWAALLNWETSGSGLDSPGPGIVKPMIGAAALNRLKLSKCASSLELGVMARMPLNQAETLYSQKPLF